MDVRKLNLNVPLLSTRRLSPGGTNSQEDLQNFMRDTSNGVPFSWELAPGKPKDMHQRGSDKNPLPPKRPPILRNSSKEALTDGDEVCCYQFHDHDDGCDGDVDDDDDDHYSNDDDVFSDAIDIFSLSETTDLESVSGANQSSNFIIQRFLPAANALAASSVLTTVPKDGNKLPNVQNNLCPAECASRTGRSYPSTRTCGPDSLFPWRMKHMVCSIKSPVLQSSSNLKRVGRKAPELNMA